MMPIYLDHSATTPLHPQVLEEMLPYFQEHFGNPSSLHSYGRAARNALNESRDRMAYLLSCDPGELIFTSGGTESDNYAIRGMVHAQKGTKNHIITTQVEHHAVLGACHALEDEGFEVTYLPVDSYGQVDIDAAAAAIRPETIMISMIYGNNEVGTLQPIESVGRLAHENQIYFHVDAVQALGKLDIKLSSLPVDLMSFSSHKINGPKGVGALYLSKNVLLKPEISGGSQERKRRAGTENLAGIVGFSKALDLALENIAQKQNHLNQLRKTMINIWNHELGEKRFVINGHASDRLPHILNVSFPGVETETLLMNLDLAGVSAASGSACTSGSLEVSHVLRAMNLPNEVTKSAIRFSFGMENSIEEVQEAARKTATIVRRIT
jgi:cysteine desulfurase